MEGRKYSYAGRARQFVNKLRLADSGRVQVKKDVDNPPRSARSFNQHAAGSNRWLTLPSQRHAAATGINYLLSSYRPNWRNHYNGAAQFIKLVLKNFKNYFSPHISRKSTTTG